MCICDYCKFNKTVPKKYAKIIFKEIKIKNNKKLLNAFIILNFSLKAIKRYNIYIPFYSKELILHTRNQTNLMYYDIGIIKCNLCNRNACPTHFLWSNFYNGKCLKCNKLVSICGWGDSKGCNKCTKTN